MKVKNSVGKTVDVYAQQKYANPNAFYTTIYSFRDNHIKLPFAIMLHNYKYPESLCFRSKLKHKFQSSIYIHWELRITHVTSCYQYELWLVKWCL